MKRRFADSPCKKMAAPTASTPGGGSRIVVGRRQPPSSRTMTRFGIDAGPAEYAPARRRTAPIVPSTPSQRLIGASAACGARVIELLVYRGRRMFAEEWGIG